MEELQSTEVLEHEILEDARKKAVRILKTADDTIIAKIAEWDKKTAETIEELRKKHDEQKAAAAEKVMARLPIDKLRIKIEKIDSMLQAAVETWYKGLSRQRIVSLLTDELSKRLALCEDISACAHKKAFYSALDRKDAETVLKTVKGSWAAQEIPTDSIYPSITLETENVRVVASIQKIIDFLIQDKREELVEALVGRAFMETA